MVDIHCGYVLHSEDETERAIIVLSVNLNVKVTLLRGGSLSMRDCLA
jgi:hypothetical protein